MVYPAGYNAVEVDRLGTGPLPGGYSGHIGLGGGEEWLCIGLDDEVAARYALDPDMAIVTPEDADTDMDDWETLRGEPKEKVTDAVRIQAIAAKQAAGIPLTQEDMDALDPDSPVRGINRRRRAVDIVAQAGAVQADIEARRGGG
jgi:hypothetical protein